MVIALEYICQIRSMIAIPLFSLQDIMIDLLLSPFNVKKSKNSELPCRFELWVYLPLQVAISTTAAFTGYCSELEGFLCANWNKVEHEGFPCFDKCVHIVKLPPQAQQLKKKKKSNQYHSHIVYGPKCFSCSKWTCSPGLISNIQWWNHFLTKQQDKKKMHMRISI